MNDDLLNILSNSNKDINNQKLMDYLAGKLSAEDRHEVEKIMAENDFMNDAVEGLEKVKDNNHIQLLVEQLNQDLHRKMEQKKLRREKRRLKEYPWIYMSLVLIITLAIIAWFIIKKLQPAHH